MVFVWNCGNGSKTYQFDNHSDVIYSVAIGGMRAASVLHTSSLLNKHWISVGWVGGCTRSFWATATLGSDIGSDLGHR